MPHIYFDDEVKMPPKTSNDYKLKDVFEGVKTASEGVKTEPKKPKKKVKKGSKKKSQYK